MSEMSTKERLLSLQNFVNSQIGEELNLTEGIKKLAEQGGSTSIEFEYNTLYLADTYGTSEYPLSDSIDDYPLLLVKTYHSRWNSPIDFVISTDALKKVCELSSSGVLLTYLDSGDAYTRLSIESSTKLITPNDDRNSVYVVAIVGITAKNKQVKAVNIYSISDESQLTPNLDFEENWYKDYDILCITTSNGSLYTPNYRTVYVPKSILPTEKIGNWNMNKDSTDFNFYCNTYRNLSGGIIGKTSISTQNTNIKIAYIYGIKFE